MTDPVRPIDPLADELEWLTGIKGLGYRTATTINLGQRDLQTLVAVIKTRRPTPPSVGSHPSLKLVEP